VGIRVFSLVFMPADALSRGVEAMTGQNIGSRSPERARTVNRLASAYSFVLLTGIGIVTFLFADAIAGASSPKPAVVSTGAEFLRIVALSFGFIGIIKSISGGFRGVGETLVAALIAVFSIGIVRIPMALVGGLNFGPVGVWWAFPLSNMLGAVLAIVLFYRDDWSDQRVSDVERAAGQVVDDVEDIDDTF